MKSLHQRKKVKKILGRVGRESYSRAQKIRSKIPNPHFPAPLSNPTALSGASRRKQIPSSQKMVFSRGYFYSIFHSPRNAINANGSSETDLILQNTMNTTMKTPAFKDKSASRFFKRHPRKSKSLAAKACLAIGVVTGALATSAEAAVV
jgi:hypothetical protein